MLITSTLPAPAELCYKFCFFLYLDTAERLRKRLLIFSFIELVAQ